MKHLIAPFATCLVVGCATAFRPFNRDSLVYRVQAPTPGLEFAYHQDVLYESGNRKYSRGARKHGMEVVAVKLKNNTGQPLPVRHGLEFYCAGKPVVPEPAASALRDVRQNTASFAWFLAMSPVNYFSSTSRCREGICDEDVTFIPVGLIIGLLLFGINGGISFSANTAFEKEIHGHDLFEKILQSGEEASGYLVFQGPLHGEMSARRASLAATPSAAPADNADHYRPEGNP